MSYTPEKIIKKLEKKAFNFNFKKYVNTGQSNKNQKNSNKVESSKWCGCYKRKSQLISNSSTAPDRGETQNSYSPSLYDREVRGQNATSNLPEEEPAQPFLNYTAPQKTPTAAFGQPIYVEVPNPIEFERQYSNNIDKSTSPRKANLKVAVNTAECKILNDDQNYTTTVQSPTYYEVLGAPGFQRGPEHYSSMQSFFSQSPISSKHCVACIIETMRTLPECCLKKACYLNPVYISNDCPSKPIY